MSDVSKISGNITPNLNNFGNIVKKSISNSVTGLQGMPQDQVTSTVDLSSFVDVKENITDAFQKFSVSYDETATKIADKAESKIGEMLRKLDSYQKEANDWWNNEAKPFFDKAAKNIEKAYIESAAIQTRVDSTAATAVLSVGEGIFKVGEWVVDGGAIVATACDSLQTLAIDLGKYVGCKVTNQEFESETAKMWNNTKDFVSNDFVGGAFDKFYDNTKVGNYLKKSSYAFDNTREFGKGFGEAIGVIAISALTFGAGGAAIGGAGAAGSAGVFGSSAAQLGVTAGAVGFGKGSEKAWSDGAGIAEGLATGAATGAWEGFQWFIGGKIGGSNIAGESHKVLNSLSRIVLDGIDGGVEGFTQPVINSIYQKGYYDENDIYVEFDEEDNYVDKVKELYDDNGGWNSVRQGFIMGSVMSALGEVSGGVKQLKNEGKTKPNKIDNDVKIKSVDSGQNKNTITFEEYQNMKKEVDVKSLQERLDKLRKIIDTDEYRRYTERNKQHEAQVLRPDFDNIDKEIASIETKLASNPISKKIEKTLKDEINSLINKTDDVETKARKLYVELNKRVSYDFNYIKGNKEVQQELLNRKVTFDNMKNNEVVCKGWSDLFNELLKDNGIDSKIVSTSKKSHYWVEINLEDSIIIADATDALGIGGPDLSNCKNGFSTLGFVKTHKGMSNTRLKNMYDNNPGVEEAVKSQWKKVDSKIEYNNNGAYLEDIVEKSRELFGKNNSNNDTSLFKLDIPDKSDGYSLFGYLNKMKEITGNSTANINYGFFKNGNNYEFTTILTENNNYMVCNNSIGKKIFDNFIDFDNFLHSNNISR